MLRRWVQATAGAGQVVLFAGEPGIGKSRLLEAVLDRVAAEPHVRLLYQCSPYYRHTAFYPLTAQLARTAHSSSRATRRPSGSTNSRRYSCKPPHA